MSALPGSVVFPHHPIWGETINSHWASQECEATPECVVLPRDVKELCTAVTILRREYATWRQANKANPNGIFAIRSGGHSPLPGAASIRGGVLIDLRFFDEVTCSEDGSSVVIGSGVRWGGCLESPRWKGSGCGWR